MRQKGFGGFVAVFLGVAILGAGLYYWQTSNMGTPPSQSHNKAQSQSEEVTKVVKDFYAQYDDGAAQTSMNEAPAFLAHIKDIDQRGDYLTDDAIKAWEATARLGLNYDPVYCAQNIPASREFGEPAFNGENRTTVQIKLKFTEGGNPEARVELTRNGGKWQINLLSCLMPQ